jgi:hypothetical protein
MANPLRDWGQSKNLDRQCFVDPIGYAPNHCWLDPEGSCMLHSRILIKREGG